MAVAILSKNFKKFAFLATILVVSLAAVNFIFAWSEPVATPPNDNAPAPINISAVPQSKSGDLSVAALYDFNDNSYYINPSATATPAGIFAGNIGIGTTGPEFKLSIDGDGGIIAKGITGSGVNLTTSGAGAKMIWYPKKFAFRAGRSVGTEWDDANIGSGSIALGSGTKASNFVSVAIGELSTASGVGAVAFGHNATASGTYSIAMGRGAVSQASGSVVIGGQQDDSFSLVNNVVSSLMVGFNSDIPTLFVGQSFGGVGTSGNVGIGTSTPGKKLDVNGAIKGVDYYSGDGSQGLTRGVVVKGSDGNNCTLTFKDGLLTAETCP